MNHKQSIDHTTPSEYRDNVMSWCCYSLACVYVYGSNKRSLSASSTIKMNQWRASEIQHMIVVVCCRMRKRARTFDQSFVRGGCLAYCWSSVLVEAAMRAWISSADATRNRPLATSIVATSTLVGVTSSSMTFFKMLMASTLASSNDSDYSLYIIIHH